jgi:hypothetical protein
MSRRLAVGLTSLWLVSAGRAVPIASEPQADVTTVAASSASDVRAVLDKYCVTCHNERTKTAGLTLDRLDVGHVADAAEDWEKVVRKLRAGAMPPLGAPRPAPAVYDVVTAWLETTLDRAAAAKPNPGRPALHRLNRAEYANAIRDVLALDVDTTTLLPPDDSSGGFDNNADVLGVSPSLLEHYLSASRKISALAVGDTKIRPATVTYRIRGDASQTGHVEGLPLGMRGGLVVRHTFPVDGEYVIKVKLLETTLGTIRGLEFPNQLDVLVDGTQIHRASVGGAEDFNASANNATDMVNALDRRLTVRVPIKAGPRTLAAAFLEKTNALGGARLQPFLRSTVDTTDHTGLPHIESVTITGPFKTTGSGETPSRRRVFVCRPTSRSDEVPCARKIVATVARRAYRRPIGETELGRLMSFYEAGRREGDFETGVESALRSVFASAKFIFRLERDPADVAPGVPYPVTDIELASRLSFFLWSSVPDDELLRVAARGRLRNPDVLAQQVRRMLADDRSQALVTNFAGQWLHLRNLRSSIPDQNVFPDFDDNLRQAFQQEAELFFASIVQENRSVPELLTADYTFVNERLAAHYGIPNVAGSHFRRVTLTDEARKGLLGKGAVLLVTSHPDRTSPVVRGKWILDNVLGTPPPPPPANVPPLPEGNGAKPRTVREQMEQHRASAVCATCHRVIDPLGFALENFDAVGAWRTRDAGSAIDASGQLTDGTRVDGVVTLRQALMKRPEVFVRTFTEKLLVYGLGRGLAYYDMPAVRAIVAESARQNYTFSSLVLALVRSTPFQMRTKVDDADRGVVAARRE